MLVAQSCLTLCNPGTAARQAPLSVRFSRQEYWSQLPFPPLGDLPNQWIQPISPVSSALQADSLPSEPSGRPKASTRSWACVAWGTGQQAAEEIHEMRERGGDHPSRPPAPPRLWLGGADCPCWVHEDRSMLIWQRGGRREPPSRGPRWGQPTHRRGR